MAWRFHAVIIAGRIPCRGATAVVVNSPRIASSATFDLNSPPWRLRVSFIPSALRSGEAYAPIPDSGSVSPALRGSADHEPRDQGRFMTGTSSESAR